MLFLRLMLLIPFLRLLLLTDEEEGSFEGAPHTPNYEDLDSLVKLHARALLHMNSLGWPLGGIQRIPVGKRWVKEPGFRRGHFETMHEEHFGVTFFPDFVIMRSGAVYRKTKQAGHRELRYEMKLLDFALVDGETYHYLVSALEHILELTPAPVYLSD